MKINQCKVMFNNLLQTGNLNKYAFIMFFFSLTSRTEFLMEKSGSLPYYDFYLNWYNIVYHDTVIQLQFMIMVIFTENL
jgi:hypothetical protein